MKQEISEELITSALGLCGKEYWDMTVGVRGEYRVGIYTTNVNGTVIYFEDDMGKQLSYPSHFQLLLTPPITNN